MNRELHEIYEKYAAELYTFILRMCADEQIAGDILQDTMLKAMTTADKFRGECSVKTWLCTIAKNLYFDRLKRAESRNIPLESAAEPSSREDIEQKLSNSDTAMHIHRLLHRLDEPYREVFTLRVFAELKFADIGSVFGKSENWAGVTFYRAKQRLIKMMKEEELL